MRGPRRSHGRLSDSKGVFFFLLFFLIRGGFWKIALWAVVKMAVFVGLVCLFKL